MVLNIYALLLVHIWLRYAAARRCTQQPAVLGYRARLVVPRALFPRVQRFAVRYCSHELTTVLDYPLP